MNEKPVLIWIIGSIVLFAFLTPDLTSRAIEPPFRFAQIGTGDSGSFEENHKILAEIFLPRDRRNVGENIQKELQSLSITRIRMQFFYPAGIPVRNIAIGKQVSADVGRFVIRLAMDYNEGIQFLVQQFRFPPHYFAIGTSAFDDLSQVSINSQDLQRLSDPSLTTSQFHTLYRRLTGEDQLPSQ